MTFKFMDTTIVPHAFNNPGGQPKPTDSRDLKLGAAAAFTSFKYTHPAILTDKAAWDSPIEYQGEQPACGAHAGSKMKGERTGRRMSPRATWADLKTFDGWAIDDGTDLRSIMKSLTKAGTVEYYVYGNDVSLTEREYAKPLTADLKTKALQNSGMGYGFITDLSFEGLKQFISDHGPTVILMRVSTRFWTAANGKISWLEKDILPLAPASAQFPIMSGHFVVAHSYDEKYVYFQNSFGDTWGRKGHGYFGVDYMPQVIDAAALFALEFKKDLAPGMEDPDVKALQQYLNAHGFLVAANGPGSPGNETTYFGPATTAALQKFQAHAGLVSSGTPSMTGYGRFGPLTRAYIQLHP